MNNRIILIMIFIGLISLFSGTSNSKIKNVQSKDGIKIVYQEEGNSDIALIFIHGWCCNKSYWENQIPVFSKKYYVAALDLGGHGESSLNRKNWTIESFGQDVASVANALKAKKIILIGHSMGGPVMVEAARYLQDKLIGLIAVDTLNNVEEKLSKKDFDEFVAPVRADFKKGTEKFIRFILFTPKTDPALIEKIVHAMASCPPEVGLGAWESLFSYDLASAMDKIKTNIRCINSDKYPNNIDAGKRHALSFEVKLLKGYGHFLMLEDPKTFNTLLEESLNELIHK